MTEQAVRDLWPSLWGSEAGPIHRLPTGSCHRVFRVDGPGEPKVVRFSKQSEAHTLGGGWLRTLAPLGLPVPRVLAADLDSDPAYQVLNFLPGRDLGDVYPSLSEAEKRTIASDLVALQDRVGRLPLAPGFGFLSSYDDPSRKARWKDVVLAHLERSRRGIRAQGLFDVRLVDEVEALAGEWEEQMARIEPRAFFDDTTTKNLLIHEGRISGIVDVDWLCFGDRLYVLALTRMSLLERGWSTSYIDYWAQAEGLSAEELRRLDFYTLVFCLDFMAEKGQQFNRDEVPTVSTEEVTKLLGLYQELWKALAP